MAGLASLVAFAYAPGMKGGFYFDELSNVVESQVLHWTDLEFERLGQTLEHAMLTSRPVANVSLALNHLHAGLDPAPYHWFNLLIHSVVGAALFWVVRVFQRKHSKDGGSAWIALLAVGVFLLHPLNIQAVTYVVQRMTSLATLFMLLALGSYLTGRYRDGRSRAAWFAAR